MCADLRCSWAEFIPQGIADVSQKFLPALAASLTVGEDLDKDEYQAVLSALGVATK